MYTQCLLVKKDLTKIAWIPSEFAKTGKVLRILDEEWSDGWVVKSTYKTVTDQFVSEHSRDFKLFPVEHNV